MLTTTHDTIILTNTFRLSLVLLFIFSPTTYSLCSYNSLCVQLICSNMKVNLLIYHCGFKNQDNQQNVLFLLFCHQNVIVLNRKFSNSIAYYWIKYYIYRNPQLSFYINKNTLNSRGNWKQYF
jgi:hypothetical protein